MPNASPHSARLLLWLCLLGTLGCSPGTSPTTWYDFQGTATLEITYRNNPAQEVVTVSAYQFFPEADFTITDTLPAGSGTRTYQVPAPWPQEVRYALADHQITFLLRPGARLRCALDLSDAQNWHPLLSGDLVKENTYLLRKEYVGYNPQPPSNQRRAAVDAVSLEAYAQQMDKIYQEEWGYFEKEKGTLPAWFRTYEQWKIKYNDAFCRLNTVVYRTHKLSKSEEVPPHYHDFLAALPLDNQDAQNVNPYYFFLYEVFNLSLNQKDSTHCPPEDFLTYHLCQAERTLSPEIRDAFKAFTLQNVYNYLKPEIARDFIRRDSATIFHDPAWLTQLSTYFDSKEKYLQAELPAPNFMLIDERDSLVSLRSLRGNIVVLCFWFAGCKPCIEEFPEENRLVARFKDQPVRIVSVCVNTSRSHWERYSKKYDLQTLNLWANDQWNSTVVEKYALAAFPRYVVIDQNQQVIAANAPRPSQGLEEYLQKLLNPSTSTE